MLFAYTYVEHHSMEKMQEYIDFIFYDVWCKAPSKGSFRLELFDNNSELKDLMTTLYYGNTKGGDFFYSHVESIYKCFATLTSLQIKQFKQWYQANNNIENICANDPAIHIVHYADIKPLYPELSKELASFFKELYSHNLLGLAAITDKIGQIDDHYKEFTKENSTGKCPFCGLSDIKGVNRSKRDAYDHYLPKSLYPFNSINFHNLAPACHECNSTCKRDKDPVYNASGRRKAFYPFADSGFKIEVKIALNRSDIDRLTPDDIQLTFEPQKYCEEIESWKEIYEIEERYKAKCCDASGGKYWFIQVMDEWQQDGLSPEVFLRTLTRQAINYPLAECNFLKKAFLDGCQGLGLFDSIA